MRIFGLVMAAMFVGPAMASDLPDDLPPDLFEIAVEVMTEPSLAEVTGICPDKLWADHSLSPAALLAEECETPTECQQQCAAGNGEGCFELARTFQEREPDVPKSIATRMFALSCAFGFAGGCTNRAAGIIWAEGDDPFASRSQLERRQCAARSFVQSCQFDDAWGCAMHADDSMTGVLGPKDVVAAKKAADKACELDPDDSVEACSYARVWVED